MLIPWWLNLSRALVFSVSSTGHLSCPQQKIETKHDRREEPSFYTGFFCAVPGCCCFSSGGFYGAGGRPSSPGPPCDRVVRAPDDGVSGGPGLRDCALGDPCSRARGGRAFLGNAAVGVGNPESNIPAVSAGNVSAGCPPVSSSPKPQGVVSAVAVVIGSAGGPPVPSSRKLKSDVSAVSAVNVSVGGSSGSARRTSAVSEAGGRRPEFNSQNLGNSLDSHIREFVIWIISHLHMHAHLFTAMHVLHARLLHALLHVPLYVAHELLRRLLVHFHAVWLLWWLCMCACGQHGGA